jgi:uncharacterized protein YndB with AHSA1/START domain
MNLLFDFTVDKATKTIHITREFAADLDLVWDAFTKAEILDSGWRPNRIRSKRRKWTSGKAAVGCIPWFPPRLPPRDVKRYSLVEYIKIQPKSSFSTKNTFADENGNSIGTAFSLVKNSFEAGAEKTTVRIEKVFDNLATVEMFATNGFIEGTAAGMNNLDEYLRTLVTHK